MLMAQEPEYLRALLKTLGYGIIFYGLLCGVMYLAQRKLQYVPDDVAFNAASYGLEGFETLPVTIDGITVNSWYRPPAAGKPVIVYAHGNAGNFIDRNFRYLPWYRAGYGIALVAYPGFEGNPGSPTEQGNYASARNVLQTVIARGQPPEKIILVGESMGTGVMVQMATEFAVGGLVLESPFTSLVATAEYHYWWLPVSLLQHDRYESLAKINRVKAPLLIIHGEQDRIVPFAQGKALFAAANEPKEAMFIPMAGHSNDMYTDAVNARIMAFIQRLIP